MKDTDKQLLKDTAMVVANGIVSLVPGLSVPWGLSKALFNSGMQLRQSRALEWVEMVQKSPEIFGKELLESKEFQDGFVYSLKEYLIERNEEKRKIFRNIFKGFSKAEDKESFPLEKFYHTLSQLSKQDIQTLKDVNNPSDDKNYQIYGNEEEHVENIYNLIHQGILTDNTGSRIGGPFAPFVNLSIFGKAFIAYINE